MTMRFKAHQSFFIRKGWLSKGLKAVEQDPAIFMPAKSKKAMDELGIGSNQVVALRYWLETTGLVRKGSKEHTLTELGTCVLDNDPYIEEMGTLWALHCNIATNDEDATSWYYLFNEYGGSTFDKESFVKGVSSFVKANNDGKEIATTSLEADFSCIVNTYIAHEMLTGKTVSPESVIDCPLGELRIIRVDGTGRGRTFRKMPANPSMLPNELLMYVMCSMDETGGEIKIDRLLNDSCSPGRLFNLDSIALLSKLYELQDSSHIHLTRTAGLDVVRIADESATPVDWLAAYYSSMN